MKKAEYYINIIGGKDRKEYPKVSGWIEEITDNNGSQLTIGYNKVEKGYWVATELATGLKCNKLNCRTKAECIEHIHNNIDVITEALNKALCGDWATKYVQPFRDFVNSREV